MQEPERAESTRVIATKAEKDGIVVRRACDLYFPTAPAGSQGVVIGQTDTQAIPEARFVLLPHSVVKTPFGKSV